MDNIAKILSDAGLENPAVAEYVAHWAGITEPAAIEVISAKDDDRLIAEGLATGEIAPAGDGLYYSRSYYKDTARSEERTVVATHNPQEAGIYNNWHDATEVTARQLESMKGASRSKTM